MRITFGLFAFKERRQFKRVYRSADAETKAKYDKLKSSDVNYRISYMKLKGKSGGTEYNFDKKRIDISINSKANNTIGSLGDELETAHQFETGKIGFLLRNDGTIMSLGYDMEDEVASKRAEINATTAVNKYENKNIQLDKTTQAFQKSDTDPNRNSKIQNYFNTDPSANQYLSRFANGGGLMGVNIPGNGGLPQSTFRQAMNEGGFLNFIYRVKGNNEYKTVIGKP